MPIEDATETRSAHTSASNTGPSTRAKSRSRSASSRAKRAHSHSRSRSRDPKRAPRSSRRSRSRSRSPTRKDRSSRKHGSHHHGSSRRRHHSRSVSTDRDHSRRSDHRSSRTRHRSRSREADGSSRKRSHRERSRSAGRRHRDSHRNHHHDGSSRRRRRDSSPGNEHRDRHQRRRRDSTSEKPTATATETEKQKPPIATKSTTSADSIATAGGTSGSSVTVTTTVAATAACVETVAMQYDLSIEKDDAPSTSQESNATSTMADQKSQSDDDETPLPNEQVKSNGFVVSNGSAVEEKTKTSTTTEITTTTTRIATTKVDVRSIKMDILKALADARCAMAGIKAVSSDSVATDGASADRAESAHEPSSSVEKCPTTTTIVDTVNVPGITEQAPPQEPLVPIITPVINTTPSKQVAAADVDEFDMFSAAELHGAGLSTSPVGAAAATAAVGVNTALQSSYDDPDGYYNPSIGEILNAKYRVLGTVGKGVFSTVLRCHRINASLESSSGEPLDVVAIKLIRSNEVMREASQIEIKILTELSERDPRDKKHCVRLLERFEHRNHVALVFESMQMNVREAMKKFGGKGGISIQAVRIFCKHLLIALSHLEACSIVHADIKPDNVLLDEKQTMIKLCDFGSAFKMHEGSHDPTPYLVSRFYRAPEIVLGLAYDKAVDMWSVGCCLYEMFTGKVMFPGGTNNEMLKLFMELKGKPPNKIIKKHRLAYMEQFQMEPHFTEDNKFCSHELDRVTGKPVLRLMDAIKTRFDLGNALLSAKSSTDDRKQVLELRNLLEKMFTLDPAKRITPKEALAHPFVKSEGGK